MLELGGAGSMPVGDGGQAALFTGGGAMIWSRGARVMPMGGIREGDWVGDEIGFKMDLYTSAVYR